MQFWEKMSYLVSLLWGRWRINGTIKKDRNETHHEGFFQAGSEGLKREYMAKLSYAKNTVLYIRNGKIVLLA